MTHSQTSASADKSPTNSVAFAAFVQQLGQGQSDAAAELLQRYATRLRMLASRRVGSRLKSKVDPDDVVQSVFGDFFNALRAGNFSIHSSRDLRGLLALMITRKCSRYVERYHSARRDVNREQSMMTVDGSNWLNEMESQQPPPDELVAMKDWLDNWLNRLDTMDRNVVKLYLNGVSTANIALQTKCSSRTVQRVLRRIFWQLGIVM